MMKPKRAVALFSAVLVVSLGLCGANLEAFRVFGLSISGGPSPGRYGDLKDNLSMLLIVAAILEVAGMVIGLLGLVVSLIMWAADALDTPWNRPPQ
jgi:hypothetical protein